MNEQCKFCSAWVPSGGIWDHLLCEHSNLKSTGPVITNISAQDGGGTSAGRRYSEDDGTNTLPEASGDNDAVQELNFDEVCDDSHVDDIDIEYDDEEPGNDKNVSAIWSYFQRYIVDGVYLGAICNLCGKNLKQPGNKSTSNLHKHMARSHDKEYESLNNRWIKKKESLVCSNKLGSKFIWMNFSKLEGHKARCNLCREILCQSHESDNPENLLKHLYLKHHAVVEKAVVWQSQNSGQKIVVVETKEEDVIESKEGIVAALETAISVTPGTGKKERRRSFAWRHFLRMNKTDAMCQLCLRTFRTCEGSTSNLLKHLNTVHFEEIRSDAEQFNKENLDGSSRAGISIPDPDASGTTAAVGKKSTPQKAAATSEDFCSLFGKQFIQEQFSCGSSRAACLWCSAKIKHNFSSSDLGSLAEHLLANHRNVCEKALAKRFKNKGPSEKVVISPKSVRDENGFEEVRHRSERSSFLFNFEDSDDEELYDVLGRSNFDVGRTTEQLIGLRKAWLKFCSEREKVHDLDITRLKTRLKEKQNILRDAEREVTSITKELAEKVKQRRRELIRQKVLDARILSKKAMRVREKFYSVKSDGAVSDGSDEDDSFKDRKEDKTNDYRAATKRHRRGSDDDDDDGGDDDTTYRKSRKVNDRSAKKHFKGSSDNQEDDEDDDYRGRTVRNNRRANVKKFHKEFDDDDDDNNGGGGYKGNKRVVKQHTAKNSEDFDIEDARKNNSRASRRKHQQSRDDDNDDDDRDHDGLEEQTKFRTVRKRHHESDNDDDGHENENISNSKAPKRRRKGSEVDDSDADWEPEPIAAKSVKSPRKDQSASRSSSSSCVTRRVSFEKGVPPNSRSFRLHLEKETAKKNNQSCEQEGVAKQSILRPDKLFSLAADGANKGPNSRSESDFNLSNYVVRNLSSEEQVEVQSSFLDDGDEIRSSINRHAPAAVLVTTEKNFSDARTDVVEFKIDV